MMGGLFKINNLSNAKKLRFLVIIFAFLIIFTAIPNTVVAQDNPKVLFDDSKTYMDLYGLYSLGYFGMSSFANLLEANGFSVSKLPDRPITPEKLKGYDVLIIMSPGSNYTDEEINSIKDFVNNGGGLYLVGNSWGVEDGDQNFAFNKISRSFGVDFASHVIVTDNKNFLVYPQFVKTTDIRSSPITNNVSEFYYLVGTYIKNPGNSTVLAYTSSDSWADNTILSNEGFSTTNEEKESNEQKGPLPIISVMEYGKGKIVFMGSSGTFVNAWIYRSNGWKLSLNSVNWLSNRPIPSEFKKAGLFSFTVADMEYRILGMLLLTLLLFLGLFFTIKHKIVIKDSRTIKTIKNWKYIVLVVFAALSVIGGFMLFIPINYMLLDTSTLETYDPYSGYTLIIIGSIFLIANSLLLFNIVNRKRIASKYSYISIAVILFFNILILVLGGLFGFSLIHLLAWGSILLIIPSLIILWFNRVYGPDLIIEGKEFDRLKKLPVKSLPFELHSSFTDSVYIGEGGFGRVFKAINNDGNDVAIKIPKSFDKRSENIFITEISNWSHLNHPNIVKLHGFKILPIPYLEMEYCEKHLEKGKKPLDEAISIIYDIARALQYSHEKNIIHGDVKPSNIMIHDGINKLSDWGLSKLTSGESITLSGATPHYAAPEQISRDFGRADERTDIYQLGTVFYEMLTGHLPFVGEISQIYNSILTNKPSIPSETNSEAKDFDEIIMKCLKKDKNKRYVSMAEFIDDLKSKYDIDRFNERTLIFKEH